MKIDLTKYLSLNCDGIDCPEKAYGKTILDCRDPDFPCPLNNWLKICANDDLEEDDEE